MELNFRLLTAEEIDCRVAQCNQYGVGLLLYKDARCDQNILDETVGPMNWQRHHTRENANCVVALWDEDKQQWIEKEDTGTESNTEKEKGLASDSFKRACFNWGIGRELYTAPNMFVLKKDLKTHKEAGEWQGKKKYTCNDVFKVTDIQYNGKKIVYVRILNLKTDKEIEFGTPAKEAREQEKIENSVIDDAKKTVLLNLAKEKGVELAKVLQRYGLECLDDMTLVQWMGAMNALNKTEVKQ